MITEAIIGKVKYFPEQLPDAAVIDIAAGAEATPIILDVRGLPGLLLRLSEIAVDRDDEVEMRFKLGGKPYLTTLTGSMFDGLANNFSLLEQGIYYNLYNKGAGGKTAYKTFFSLWVIKPTIAHKLRYGIPLTPEEKKLSSDLNIANEVEKGMLPLPLDFQIQREYQISNKETHGFQVTVPTTGVSVETITPGKNEFVGLTKLSADPGDLAGDNIRVAIDRDYIPDYVEFPTWALGTTAGTTLGKEISCFIPALNELRIKLKATTSKVINIRFTVLRCVLTNMFRVKWGLVTREELPDKQKEAYDKIIAGVF